MSEDVLDGVPDNLVALGALKRQGHSEADAMKILLADTSAIPRIAAGERAHVAKQAEKIRQNALAASPAGRIAAAKKAAEAQEARAKLVADARTLLESEGNPVPEDASEEEILHYVRIEERFDWLPLNEQHKRQEALLGNSAWDSMSLDEKMAVAEKVGMRVSEIDRGRAIQSGATSDDVGELSS
jgi:hypothetical protein